MSDHKSVSPKGQKKHQRPRGPKPQTLALPGKWTGAVKKALKKKPE